MDKCKLVCYISFDMMESIKSIAQEEQMSVASLVIALLSLGLDQYFMGDFEHGL